MSVCPAWGGNSNKIHTSFLFKKCVWLKNARPSLTASPSLSDDLWPHDQKKMNESTVRSTGQILAGAPSRLACPSDNFLNFLSVLCKHFHRQKRKTVINKPKEEASPKVTVTQRSAASCPWVPRPIQHTSTQQNTQQRTTDSGVNTHQYGIRHGRSCVESS